jgi:hypothetical protein
MVLLFCSSWLTVGAGVYNLLSRLDQFTGQQSINSRNLRSDLVLKCGQLVCAGDDVALKARAPGAENSIIHTARDAVVAERRVLSHGMNAAI